MIYRIIGLVCILTSILVLPYWIYVPVLFIGIVLFPFFWEGIVLVFLINVIHGGSVEFPAMLTSSLVLFVLVVLIVMLPIRKRLRSYV